MRLKRFFVPFIAVGVLLVVFVLMQNGYTQRFDEMDKKYSDAISVNLDGGISKQGLVEVLERNGYADCLEDAQFIATVIYEKLKGDTLPDAVTDLNKRRWQVPVERIEAEGTPSFFKKLEDSRIQLGQTMLVDSLYQCNLPSVLVVNEGGKGSIKVSVKEAKRKEELSTLDNILRKKTKPVQKVLVQLDKHLIDSTNTACSIPLGYALTDAQGMVCFEGLDETASYSVLPIKRGSEFGTPKGTTQGMLAEAHDDASPTYTFTMQPHMLRLFSAQTLQRIKEDGTITVRTPQEFKDTLHFWFVLFIMAWLLLFVLGNIGKNTLDNGMASLLMLLTGFSLLIMFGINDPLTERMLGEETAQGIIVGVLIAAFLQRFDFLKFYQDNTVLSMVGKKWRLPFDAIAYYMAGKNQQRYLNTKGISYLLAAIFLTSLLFVVGQSVGGMKVNLNFFGLVFQPSEIAKYLMIFFMAAWFCRNGETITRYSEEGANHARADVKYIHTQFVRKLKRMGWLLAGMAFLLALYAVLGDMGPAMVLTLTFIVLYSLVKSRSTLQGGESTLFTCDMAYLIYGAGSFIAVLVIGQLLGLKGVLAGLWFVGWYLFGLERKKIHESAVIFNLVICAFVFGPVWLEGTSVGERLASRNEMCTNTWGDLALDGGIPVPGVNTQVAEGLWGLASGGVTGQGIGNGSQHFIPAFHTDFILESVGEQLGFLGLAFLIILLSLLLRKALLAGFHSKHYFTLYLCAGIAVVTGIQFIIIALGSTGMIPLTGITVPFLSFGRVSMILNLAAFGMVMSITSKCQNKDRRSTFMQPYENPVLMTCLAYTVILIGILGVFFHYQVLSRDETLLRPVFVYNTEGAATVQYNPRIEKVASQMKPGNIYDRKGVLVATSFPDSLAAFKGVYSKYGVRTDFRKVEDRYYPFGENLFFMLGDYNSKLFFSSTDGSPRGYMAEARHLAELRGYDNVLCYPDGSKKKVDLVSMKYKPNKFLPATSEFRQDGFQLRDYTALLPYVKAGYASGRIERFNARNERILDFGALEPEDLYLTVDAGLQTRLHQALADYPSATKRYSHLQRTSVVVIDAASGDLLASANWPLPDYERLAEEKETYRDRYRKKGEWTAYTDMDLGITFATPPGSTAKVMSALAGLRKLDEEGGNIQDKVYSIYKKELIHATNGSEPVGRVNMHQAIVESSNVYFINLVNDMNLYEELAHVYESAGISIGVPDNAEKPAIPAYRFDYDSYDPISGWKNRVTGEAEKATSVYRDYISQRKRNNPDTHRHMTFCEPWRWAWGQGTMDATPLAMARVAATVVNDGNMPMTRFLLSDETKAVPVVSKEKVEDLRKAMVAEAHKPLRDKSKRFAAYPSLGGKTGTPERVLDLKPRKKSGEKQAYMPVNPDKGNDGWYICFVEGATVSHIEDGVIVKKTVPLAIAVRAERTVSSGSSYAKGIADKLVMDVLAKEGYFAK